MVSLAASAATVNNVIEREDTSTPHARGFRHLTRRELARLHHDGVAQILSFFPVSYVPTLPTRYAPSLHHHTLSAVSPHVRLYAEALVNRTSTTAAFAGVQVSEGRLVYYIVPHGSAPSLPRLALALWWAERCGVPVVLSAPDACRRLLSMLTMRLRRRVEQLCVVMRATALDDLADATMAGGRSSDEDDDNGSNDPHHRTTASSGGCGRVPRSGSLLSHRTSLRTLHATTDTAPPLRLSCTTVVRALSTFACLTSLTVDGDFAANPATAAAAVADALRVVRGMAVTTLHLWRCTHLTTVSHLAGAPHLEVLSVRGCGIDSVDGLSSCPALLQVDVSRSEKLTDLSGLAGAPRLRTIVCCDSAVVRLDGLNRCLYLKSIDLSGNAELRSISGLVGAPRLEVIRLGRTAVSDLAALGSCPCLATVDVRGCREVGQIAPLVNVDILRDHAV